MQNPIYANGKPDVELINGNYVVTARFTTDQTKGEAVSRTVYSRHAAWMLYSALREMIFSKEETASVAAFSDTPTSKVAKSPRSRGKASTKTKPQHKD